MKDNRTLLGKIYDCEFKIKNLRRDIIIISNNIFLLEKKHKEVSRRLIAHLAINDITQRFKERALNLKKSQKKIVGKIEFLQNNINANCKWIKIYQDRVDIYEAKYRKVN